MNRQFHILFFFCFCFFTTEAFAELSSFVADAVQSVPGQEVRRGKLYVSDIGTRFEFTVRKQKVIQIIKPSQGIFWLLFPKTKTYFERKSRPSRLLQGRRSVLPCLPDPQGKCRKLGVVKSGKMYYENWIAIDPQTKGMVSIWWDPVRHMYIRQVFTDGSNMVAQMTGTRQFEGRFVEQWIMTVTLASGARYYSYMLYAPDLGFPIMEKGSGGLVKELHNIKPLKADASLYVIPPGYQKRTVSPNPGHRQK
jgi:hypothetical protein